ncbi:MAG: GNAT family N-acetyltransferase [Novosphingobium sp.]|nr:GNAT family N-acetyltransferase [Novosphingobium sp.]
MTDALPVNPASLDDASAIAAIYGHYVEQGTATFETEPPSVEEMAGRMRKTLDGGYPWLVSRDGAGEVLGYAYASRFHPRDGYRYACEVSIYVRQDSHGKGLGTALLNALLEHCEALGLRQAIAVIAGTEPASVVLHARAGFRPCGTLEKVGRKHGQWIDVFFMQRSLGEGDDTAPPEEP